MTFSNSQMSPTTTGHIQEGKRAGERTTRHSRSSYPIVHTFIFSQAHLFMLESTPYFLKTATWTDNLTHSCQPQATAGKLSRCQPNRITAEGSHNSTGRETGGTSMCCLRHPQYRWYDRRIQPRPNHSAGGNSEGETKGTSSSSYTQETR